MIIKRQVQNLCYKLIYLPIYLLGMTPYSILNVLIGRVLFFLAYRVFRYRYLVIAQNISRSFPQKSYQDVEQLIKAYYQHLAAMIVEVTRFFSIRPQQLLRQVSFSNIELLDRYHSQNRNVIVLLGHYGNWECLNVLPIKLPYQVNAIYKPLTNQIAERFAQRVRGRFGVKLIPSSHALRQLLKPHERPQLSLFIADQYPGKNTRCELPFLNQSTLMFNGAEKLARATNAVVVYAEIVPLKTNCWGISFSLITESAAQTHDHQITTAFCNKLEDTIVSRPAYWLWSHRRWKESLPKLQPQG
jgi:Kdo2-lipid IVA lauroyltransferase/acyltransferase